MKQKSFVFQDSFDAVKFLDQVKNSDDYKNAKNILVNIFTGRIDYNYISYIKSIVKERLGRAVITGLSCLYEFAHGERSKNTTIFTILFFDNTELNLLEYDFSKLSLEEAQAACISKLDNIPDIKGVQVFTTPGKNSISHEFLSSISSHFPDVPIFGAGASYDEKSKNHKLYVFGNEIYENALVMTVFSSKTLAIYAESTLGWTPIGKVMTATDVADSCILKTIDGEVAGEIYKKYLGVISSEAFVENTCEFPFMLKRGSKWISRMPVEKDENGYIHFTSDISKGEKLVFSYGSKKIILQNAFKLAEYMSRKNLEGLLLHVCRNRHIYLKEDEIFELLAFSNFYRETAGCFAFSEILYRNNNGGMQNSALVAVGFREFASEQEQKYAEDCYIEDTRYENNRQIDFSKNENDFSLNNRDKVVIPFEERIVNFLHATGRDLYLANIKLEEAATTDGLTKLYNRKKISECIETAVKNYKDKDSITLIMFDIDNFKKINDTYGHDMGDEVLARIAGTAKGCIRHNDAIGRWGGEEFMILIKEAPKEIVVSIAEKIRCEINSLQWKKMNPVSISLGVAELVKGDDSQTLYKRVDNRLYYAKTHGKNKVISEDLE